MVGKETFDLVSLWIALLFPWLCPGRFARFVLWLGLRFVARQTLILPRNNGICNKKKYGIVKLRKCEQGVGEGGGGTGGRIFPTSLGSC